MIETIFIDSVEIMGIVGATCLSALILLGSLLLLRQLYILIKE